MIPAMDSRRQDSLSVSPADRCPWQHLGGCGTSPGPKSRHVTTCHGTSRHEAKARFGGLTVLLDKMVWACVQNLGNSISLLDITNY